ncbi:hypothetical protein [uncultured Sphingomonas sp.]|uniref:hypothetical protein n=1 Tax=uncultured Sphingomonas sp. TaxID=158754 RepID=UPI0025993BCB|nr:hypothetical protein [uncultured Sphingomonas sp.]
MTYMRRHTPVSGQLGYCGITPRQQIAISKEANVVDWGDYLGIAVDDDAELEQGTVERIAAVARVSHDPAAVERLRSALGPMGRRYRRIIAIVPSNLERAPSHDGHTERLDWLDTHVLFPLKSLIPALADDKRHMFAMWPHELRPEKAPDWKLLQEQLDILLSLVQNATLAALFHRENDISAISALRYSIVGSAMAALDEALPNMKPSRGTYDRETKRFNGLYPDVIRAIYREITGEDEKLDRVIKEVLEDRRDPESLLNGKPFSLGDHLSALLAKIRPSTAA